MNYMMKEGPGGLYEQDETGIALWANPTYCVGKCCRSDVAKVYEKIRIRSCLAVN